MLKAEAARLYRRLGLFLIDHKTIIAPSKIIAAVFRELGRKDQQSSFTLGADSEAVKSHASERQGLRCFELFLLFIPLICPYCDTIGSFSFLLPFLSQKRYFFCLVDRFLFAPNFVF